MYKEPNIESKDGMKPDIESKKDGMKPDIKSKKDDMRLHLISGHNYKTYHIVFIFALQLHENNEFYIEIK